MNLFDKISKIIGEAQRNSATHARGVTKLKAICIEERASAEFKLGLAKCIHAFLRQDYKLASEFVNRVCQFIALFCLHMQEHHAKNIDADSDDPVVSSIFKLLIEMSQTHVDSVRFRSCQFISAILASLVGIALEADMLDRLQDAMLACFQDRVIQTRVQAAIVLNPLQTNGPNIGCPVIDAFIDRLLADPSARVRMICAEKIALNRVTVPVVVEASTDIDANVRLAAYKRAWKYPQQFKITHKQQLIKNGFRDSSDVIKKFVARELIPAWLEFFEFNYIRLLKALRLDSNWDDLRDTVEVSEFTLNTLFQVRQTAELLTVLKFDENKLLPLHDLNWETVIYWRIFLEHLRKMNPDDVDVDSYIPHIPMFCTYIEDYCKLSMEKVNSTQDHAYQLLEFNFTLSQLFTITNNFDFADIICQQCANELIANVIKTYELDFEVLNGIIIALNKSMPDLKRQTSYICDLLGDLLCPSLPMESNLLNGESVVEKSATVVAEGSESIGLNTTQQQYGLAQLRIQFHTLTSKLCEAVAEEDYTTASDLKKQIDAIKAEISAIEKPKAVAREPIIEEAEDPCMDMNDEDKESNEREQDPVVVTRALNIMAAFLKYSNLNALHTNIAAFKMNHIDEMIHSSNWHIRMAALKCLALCCVIDERSANISIGTFCGFLMKHNNANSNVLPYELVYYTVGAIIDCLVKFGSSLLANIPEGTILSTSTNEEEQEVFSGGYSLSTVIRELLHLLNDENPKLQELSGIGICNLILTTRVQSYAVLSKLILKYISPLKTEAPTVRLQQYIGVTLQRLPTIPNSAHQFVRAILPSLNVIIKAPVNSPLNHVDLDAIAKLLLNICTTFTESKTLQMELAANLLTELQNKPNSNGSFAYTKLLLRLEYDTSQQEQIKTFVEIIDNLRSEILDKKVEANLIKLNTRLTIALNGAINTLEPQAESDASEHDSDS